MVPGGKDGLKIYVKMGDFSEDLNKKEKEQKGKRG